MRPVRVARRIIKETLLVSRTRTNRDVWEPCHRRNEASKPIWSYSNVLDRKHVITAVEDHFGRKELEPYAGLAPFVDERKLDHRPLGQHALVSNGFNSQWSMSCLGGQLTSCHFHRRHGWYLGCLHQHQILVQSLCGASWEGR